MTKATRVPVTTRAIIQRINRKLRREDKMLKKPRGAWTYDLGDYYIVDIRRNLLDDVRVDPETLARELGVLQDYEEVVE